MTKIMNLFVVAELLFKKKKWKILYMLFRLCLVTVKYFLKNKYFPEMLFSGKENIFKCLIIL